MKKLYLIPIILILFYSSVLADGFIIPVPVPHQPPPPNLSVKYHHVDVVIDNQVAQTKIDQVFLNHYNWELEGQYIFPIPEGAGITRFSMYMGGEEIKGRILDRGEARRIYEEIVRKRKDPALLEYFGQGMFQARVYPIPANGEARIKIFYSQLLKNDFGVCEYRYPLNTEKFSAEPLQSVKISVRLKSSQSIKNIYSPTHNIKIDREGENQAVVSFSEENTKPNQDFVLYYTLSQDEIGFNLMTYQSEDDGNFFLALISPKVDVLPGRIVKKKIIFILDSSGSMQGEKIKQAKNALQFCLNSLNTGDQFNLIDFDDEIRKFESRLVPATPKNIKDALKFVDEIQAEGGTDINNALLYGLKQFQSERAANYLIFLTDGLPTVGETNINNILENVKEENYNNTRVFVFGVGYDVNTHLLDKLAQTHHATSDYVKPNENIEVKVSNFYKKISSPILTNIELDFGRVKVFDIYPKELPDIFKGSQLVIMGKFEEPARTQVVLQGKSDSEKNYIYQAGFSNSKERYSFIPKLWATRKVGYLTDEIRLYGRNQELIDEIVRLSKRYGIITEYTSFLVDADRNLAFDQMRQEAGKGLEKMSVPQSGMDAVVYAQKPQIMKDVTSGPRGYIDEKGKERPITNLAQTGNKTFFYKTRVWMDSEYEVKEKSIKIQRFSSAYFQLANANPEIGKFLALGEKVIFKWKNSFYEIDDQGKQNFTEKELDQLR
jgi:Ca-activated chloride channel family protein